MKDARKQYLLFMGDTYYPSGGWSDFITSSDSLFVLFVEFLAHYYDVGCDWVEIVDTQSGQVLATSFQKLTDFIRFAEGICQ